MHFYNLNIFAEMATCVRDGNLDARGEFREQLDLAMLHLVRQTLRDRAGSSPIARRIMAEAKRVRPVEPVGDREERDRFLRDVTRRVCDGLVAGLREHREREFAVGDSIRVRDGGTLVMS